MESHLPLQLIQDLAVILIAAAIAAAACRRIGLSPIVGYLAAGVIVGTPQITFIYVTDPLRVQLLSQLGLVFLMFSIGLGFRLQRFSQLGVGIIAATLCTALVTLTFTRLLASWLGFGQAQSIFFAALLMVSSSAVIGKTLISSGMTHRRHGQLALGITLCEDIVAIVLLAFLGSYSAMEPTVSQGWFGLGSKVGALMAFAALLLVPGLIFIPRLLGRLGRSRDDTQELETLVSAGLLFGMAFLTLRSGYSLALGSFLCGMIVAESPRVRSLSENFSGLRDIFVAVFFVAIGMSIDITLFPSAIGLILLGSALALLLRPLAAAFGLLLACESPSDAAKAGLNLSPIGEFSFVIAGLGVGAGLLDQRFQIAAVGIALTTTILYPWVMRGGEAAVERLTRAGPNVLQRALQSYQNLWQLIGARQNSSLIWKLLRPRLPQVSAEILFVSAILIFSEPLYLAFLPAIEETEGMLRLSYEYGYWVAIAMLALGPLIALARNINALAMLMADYLTHGLSYSSKLRGALSLVLRGLALTALGFWILNIIPLSWLSVYTLVGVLAAILLALVFGWRTLVRLHSEAAFTLREVVGNHGPSEAGTQALMLVQEDWGIQLDEWVVGETSLSGRSIGDLQIRKRSGATVVGIERHGHYLPSIGPETHVFAGDRLFLTGSQEQLDAARSLLVGPSQDEQEEHFDYRDAILETGLVNPGATAAGQSLKDLRWPRLLGVQVVALRKGPNAAPRQPEATDTLEPGDTLLLVGSPRALAAAKDQLAAPPPPDSPVPRAD